MSPKTKRKWWTCLASGKPAPCGYNLHVLGCGWWYQSSDEDAPCCHSPSPAEREAWLAAKESDGTR